MWEGRFKSALIDSETYLLTCYCYIEQNPLRAGMVSDLSQYPWSSYAHNANAVNDDLVQAHELYLSLGNNHQNRCLNYQKIFTQVIPEKTIKMIREITNKGIILGNDKFRPKLKHNLNAEFNPNQEVAIESLLSLNNKGKSSDTDPFDLTPLICGLINDMLERSRFKSTAGNSS